MTRALGLLVPLVFIAACRTPGPGVLLGPDDPRPAALVAGLEVRAESPAALRARARLDLDARDVSLDRPQRLAVERPARLRVEVLGLFDQLAAVVVTNGDTYQVFDARSRDLEDGVVDPHLLWRVARVDLAPAEAVDLMLGGPRPDPSLREGEAREHANGDVAVTRIDGDGLAREAYRFDAAGRVVEATLFDATGALVWRAAFDDYRAIASPDGGEVAFAHDVRLEFPRVDARARLVFKTVVLADDLPDALFALELPGRSGRASYGPGGSVAHAHTGGLVTR